MQKMGKNVEDEKEDEQGAKGGLEGKGIPKRILMSRELRIGGWGRPMHWAANKKGS